MHGTCEWLSVKPRRDKVACYRKSDDVTGGSQALLSTREHRRLPFRMATQRAFVVDVTARQLGSWKIRN